MGRNDCIMVLFPAYFATSEREQIDFLPRQRNPRPIRIGVKGSRLHDN